MKRILTIFAAFALVLAVAPVTAMGDEDDDLQADRTEYNRMIRELRRVRANYNAAYNEAVAEARENNGEASMDTKARVLALRDEFDRKMMRLTMLALRHGWDVPTFDDVEAAPVGSPANSTQEYREQIFSPVDSMVRSTFRIEAYRIAARLTLPVISISIDD